MHGKSGTGKTLLAKALAKESGVNFISVQSASIISRFMGESERALREVFRVARQAAPSILYFDGIDALISARSSNLNSGSSLTEDRLAAQFMSEMNGIEELTGVVVLATTNRIDLLDQALLASGRFDLVLELPLPDLKAREEIFKIELAKKQLAPDVNLKVLASKTDGMSGADIAKICRKAAMQALKSAVNNNDNNILIQEAYFDV